PRRPPIQRRPDLPGPLARHLVRLANQGTAEAPDPALPDLPGALALRRPA
ncbi:MAG: hypothetical protein QOF11_46, partial [Chloroflexota bacterium]|nr:hypothetical protein [Chloroflexota bacterium]